jgi:hypothetical protein
VSLWGFWTLIGNLKGLILSKEGVSPTEVSNCSQQNRRIGFEYVVPVRGGGPCPKKTVRTDRKKEGNNSLIKGEERYEVTLEHIP